MSSSTGSLGKVLGQEDEDQPLTEEQDQPEIGTLDTSSQELQNQLLTAEEKVKEYWERILRMQAETDNIKRRAEQDIAKAHNYGLQKFVSELLPIIDNLERAIFSHQNEASEAGTLLDGVNLTLKMFMTTLEKFGVEQIDPISQPFNPELHQAISMKEDASAKPGVVIQVLQKGYLLNKRLIRPALVIVAK